MAARQLLLYVILWVGLFKVHPQTYYYGVHVTEEGRSVTVLCPPHNESYTMREWTWYGKIPLRTISFYIQDRGVSVNDFESRPDMSLNLTDFSLTINSLQVEDTGQVRCAIYTGISTERYGFTRLIIYNRWLRVRSTDSSVTVPCPVATARFTTRQWHSRPYHWLIYSQNSSGVTEGREARNDMSLDTDTFSLMIGNVRPDDYTLTCSVITSQGTLIDLTFLAIYKFEFEAEENTSVTLPCDTVVDVMRYFASYPGPVSYSRIWQRLSGDLLYHQYPYDGVFYERSPAARADMSLNNETFAVTIGRTQLEDDAMFVCIHTSQLVSGRYVESVKLNIYIRPKVVLSGLDDTPVSVGSTVTVTCTIDRVYPELEPGDFIMRWGTQTIMSTGSQNNDASYRYSVQYIHTVSNDVNGTVVECAVNMRKGRSDSISKTIIVDAQNQEPPLSLPVIGGAAAAAAVLIIIVIIITVCVCARRKTRVNKVTDQTRQTVESHHRHQLHAPDITSHAETYLPGANYHQYEEMPEQAPAAELSGKLRYEKLEVKANTPIDKWFKDRDIPNATAKKLERHDIVTLQHLQDMSPADVVEAGLSVGERNRIRRALKESNTSRF